MVDDPIVRSKKTLCLGFKPCYLWFKTVVVKLKTYLFTV